MQGRRANQSTTSFFWGVQAYLNSFDNTVVYIQYTARAIFQELSTTKFICKISHSQGVIRQANFLRMLRRIVWHKFINMGTVVKKRKEEEPLSIIAT
jgi:hypothetical protein